MVRIYKNDIAYIVCEVKIFKNDISIGTTNSIIYDDFIIEFFRPDPIAINKQLAEGKQNKIGFQHINQ